MSIDAYRKKSLDFFFFKGVISMEHIFNHSLFSTDDMINISAERTRLYSRNNEWTKQDIVHVNFSDFQINEQASRYCIDYNSIPYELLYFPDKSHRLFVSLSSGHCFGAVRNYPVFHRWTYKPFLDGHLICFDDPMFISNPTAGVLWYYGTKEHSYLSDLADIIKKIAEQVDCSISDICIFGSSGGGTASIMLGNLLPGCTIMAINPQFKLSIWNASITKYFLENLHIDLTQQDKFERNYVLPLNNCSTFLLVLNPASPRDKKQFMPALQKLNIPLKYGLSEYGNIITFIHFSINSVDLHHTMPEQILMRFLFNIIFEYKISHDTNKFKEFGYLIAELLNKKYGWISTLGEMKKNYTELQDKYQELSISYNSNHELLESNSVKIIELENRVKEYEKCIRKLNKIKKKSHKLQLQITSMKKTPSWRIGYAITWPFRTVRKLWPRMLCGAGKH